MFSIQCTYIVQNYAGNVYCSVKHLPRIEHERDFLEMVGLSSVFSLYTISEFVGLSTFDQYVVDEGWPLGLQPLNSRIELVRNSDNGGSISFNTLLTGSPSSSTDSSSDLDTESTGSFFPDKSTTLGSLMGVSSIVELSRRSLRGTKIEAFKNKKKKLNFSSWLFCLRSRSRNPEAENHKNNPPSLGQFLAVERRATNENRRTQNPLIYSPDDELALVEANLSEQNSLFMNGIIAPPHSLSPRQSIGTERESMELGHGNKWFGSFAQLFSCVCGQYALY
ncbi:hypothetical protein VNO77_29015 [Canavalia gladiata]|uniref:Uncharacterized protein n=1 Tax=Canavalia gladiata TaxID=3824 RepID=A0AAN9KWN4_CANGL